MNQKQVVVIAGPSGSGESTITNEIVKRFTKRVRRLVTATTRTPREGEKHGVDYYFFSKDEFEKKRQAGDILESTYVENRDAYYGTYAPDLKEKLAAGYVVVMNPDLVGAKYYKKEYGATTIFIVPENPKSLEDRLRKRNPDMTDKEIAQRHENAMKELKEEQPFYDYTVVNPDNKLEQAVTEVVGILRKEGYTLES
jgi:guanylate kinase